MLDTVRIIESVVWKGRSWSRLIISVYGGRFWGDVQRWNSAPQKSTNPFNLDGWDDSESKASSSLPNPNIKRAYDSGYLNSGLLFYSGNREVLNHFFIDEIYGAETLYAYYWIYQLVKIGIKDIEIWRSRISRPVAKNFSRGGGWRMSSSSRPVASGRTFPSPFPLPCPPTVYGPTAGGHSPPPPPAKNSWLRAQVIASS